MQNWKYVLQPSLEFLAAYCKKSQNGTAYDMLWIITFKQYHCKCKILHKIPKPSMELLLHTQKFVVLDLNVTQMFLLFAACCHVEISLWITKKAPGDKANEDM